MIVSSCDQVCLVDHACLPTAADADEDALPTLYREGGGGTLLRQVIALGLLDELDLHIAPVILGDGMRLLDHRLGLDILEGIELTPDRVTATDDVTHISYRVRERRALVLDNRGHDEKARVA